MQTKRAKYTWSCATAASAWAASKVLGSEVSEEKLIRYIGHDGSKMVSTALPEPICRAGFHWSEIIGVLYLRYQIAVVPFEPAPQAEHDNIVVDVENELVTKALDKAVSRCCGVFVGENRKAKVEHAVGWEADVVSHNGIKGLIYDPATGKTGSDIPIDIRVFLAFLPLNNID